MALIPIMGQPVNLVPLNPSNNCPVENPYCVLYGKEDEESIMVQMEQTPCESTLVSNGNFVSDADWTFDADVVIADGKATHVVGVSGEISQDIYSAYAFGNYFSVKFTVTGMSGGTINVHIAETAATHIITENGIYTFYGTPPFDNTLLKFVFSADCDASISAISSFKLLGGGEISAFLVDIATGAVVATPIMDLLDEFIVWSVDTDTLDEGCYRIEIIDPCAISGELTDVFLSPDFETPSDWTITSNIPTAFINNIGPPDDNVFWFDVTSTGPPHPNIAYASQPFAIPTTQRLYVEFEVDKTYLGPLAGISVVLYAADGGVIQEIIRKANTDVIGCSGLTNNCTFYTILPANYLYSSNLDIGVMIEDDSTLGGNVNWIAYAQMRYAVLDDNATGFFTSNCLTVKTDVSGTTLVEGFADEINEGSNRSLGFMFNPSYFWLRARLALQFSNPHSPIKTENYLYSSGRKKKAYAQVGKAWDLTFHAVDENMHDTIANIINCDVFTINGNQYITDEKEYTANYGPKGVDPVGESTIEVQKIENTRFNTNI